MPIKMKKAEPGQGFIKMCLYGDAGTGKTLTGLWISEWLAKAMGKRVAMIDTERGADFYGVDIPERKIHPKAFDFDRDITRSITDVRVFLQDLARDPGGYGVVFIDSITHLWQAAQEAYTGKMTKRGSPPFQAWNEIKRPYKDMLAAGLSGQFHFIYAGRLGWNFEEDEESERDRVTGTRVQAERNTGYEPHLTWKMTQYWPAATPDGSKPGKEWQIRAYVEKDRSGCLQGKTLVWPKPQDLEPVLKYLSGGQAALPTFDEAAEHDATQIQADKEVETLDQRNLYQHIRQAILASNTDSALREAWNLTVSKKKRLGSFWDDLYRLKEDRKAEIALGLPVRGPEQAIEIGDLQEVES